MRHDIVSVDDSEVFGVVTHHQVAEGLVSCPWWAEGVEQSIVLGTKLLLHIHCCESGQSCSQRVAGEEKTGGAVLLEKVSDSGNHLRRDVIIGRIEASMDLSVGNVLVGLHEEVNIWNPVSNVIWSSESNYDLIILLVVCHISKYSCEIIWDTSSSWNSWSHLARFSTFPVIEVVIFTKCGFWVVNGLLTEFFIVSCRTNANKHKSNSSCQSLRHIKDIIIIK